VLRSMFQLAIRTTVAAARKPRIANHQMCQISEKPMTPQRKRYETGRCYAAFDRFIFGLISPPVRFMCQNASIV
jgi:hypothetical protein